MLDNFALQTLKNSIPEAGKRIFWLRNAIWSFDSSVKNTEGQTHQSVIIKIIN